MYRTTLKVLNPKLRQERMGWTQLDNLQQSQLASFTEQNSRSPKTIVL
jgi:hypothetical protein